MDMYIKLGNISYRYHSLCTTVYATPGTCRVIDKLNSTHEMPDKAL